uniref:Replication initiator protein n=1 Tax=Dulem virus 240 TaxID=3145717 RepID=A0AAU8B6Y1_9VIRU
MCLNPVQILNPNFRATTKYANLSCTQFKYIYVPCGHCAECLRLKQSYLIQRFREQCKGYFAIFITLTYQDSMIPFIDDSNGERHYYADFRDVQLMFKRIRKDHLFPEFKYFLTSEFGGTTHRPHFHAIIFVKREAGMTDEDGIRLASDFEQLIFTQWKRNVGKSTKYPIYKPLCQFVKNRQGNATWDCHLCVSYKGENSDYSDVMYYVSKYCLKYDEWYERYRHYLWHNLPEDEYNSLLRVIRPRFTTSKHFGISDFTKEDIADMLDFSMQGPKMAVYVNPDGSTFPMSPYYKKRYMTVSQKAFFILHNPNVFRKDEDVSKPALEAVLDASMFAPVIDLPKRRAVQKKFDKMRQRIYHKPSEVDSVLVLPLLTTL